MSLPPLITFAGGADGPWRVMSQRCIAGEDLPAVAAIVFVEGEWSAPPGGWRLRGVVSNTRYATRSETKRLGAQQEAVGRPQARRGALIPIRKSASWWALAQDERRTIFEEQSHHTAIGLDYLPAVARRLHHCRDLGEPFDFLTWFEFAPEHETAFDDLLVRLRKSAEWAYVEREVEIRLERS